MDAVKNGVNVVIWFAVNLAVDEVTRLPIVQGIQMKSYACLCIMYSMYVYTYMYIQREIFCASQKTLFYLLMHDCEL